MRSGSNESVCSLKILRSAEIVKRKVRSAAFSIGPNRPSIRMSGILDINAKADLSIVEKRLAWRIPAESARERCASSYVVRRLDHKSDEVRLCKVQCRRIFRRQTTLQSAIDIFHRSAIGSGSACPFRMARGTIHQGSQTCAFLTTSWQKPDGEVPICKMDFPEIGPLKTISFNLLSPYSWSAALPHAMTFDSFSLDRFRT